MSLTTTHYRAAFTVERRITTWHDITDKSEKWRRYMLSADWTPDRVLEVRNLDMTYGGESDFDSLMIAVRLKNKIKNMCTGRLLTVLSDDATNMIVFFENEKDALLTKLFYQKMTVAPS